MKCQKCSEDSVLPFRCPHCGGLFCSVHRLPENHGCVGLNSARVLRQDQVGGGFSYNYGYSLGSGGSQGFGRAGHVYFGRKEMRHVLVAALLVVGIGFSIGLWGNFFGDFGFVWGWGLMGVFAGLVCVSFLVHEFCHKVVAQRNGLWAEFRLTLWGAVLTFLSVFLPFKLIAPGAMMIGGSPNKKQLLKISVAGPLSNMVFAGVFLAAGWFAGGGLGWVLFFAGYVNAFIGLFNLVPFGVLDGYKIFSVDKRVWATCFGAAVGLTVLSWLFYSGYFV